MISIIPTDRAVRPVTTFSSIKNVDVAMHVFEELKVVLLQGGGGTRSVKRRRGMHIGVVDTRSSCYL